MKICTIVQCMETECLERIGVIFRNVNNWSIFLSSISVWKESL